MFMRDLRAVFYSLQRRTRVSEARQGLQTMAGEDTLSRASVLATRPCASMVAAHRERLCVSAAFDYRVH